MDARTWMSVCLGTGLLWLTAGVPVWAKSPSEDQIRQLLKVLDVQSQFTQMDAQLASVMGQQMPCVSAAYWQNFVDADGAKQLITRMIPIYQRHFTADDIEGMLKFYRSPLGQKVIAQMPLTMNEGAQSGQEWGAQRIAQMQQALRKDGKINAQGRCLASSGAVALPLGPAKSP